MTASDGTIRRFLLRAIPDGSRVLDVGCGTGWAALTIARERPACVVHGADSDFGAVHRVNTRVRRLKRRPVVHCYPCAAENLVRCFGLSQYDIAVSVHSLHHYANPFRALQNVRRVLRRGGRVLLAELEPQYGETLDDCPRFSLDKIVELCDEAGLNVTAARAKRPGVLLVAAQCA